MWHTVLIALHALSGAVALMTGLVAHRGRALFETYLWSLVATVIFLALAVVEEWSRLDAAAQVLFAAFTGLGVVMVWLATRARGLPLSPRYVSLVGFTVVALFDAFIVITVLNVGAPVFLVVASGVLVAIGGHFVLRAINARLLSEVAASR